MRKLKYELSNNVSKEIIKSIVRISQKMLKVISVHTGISGSYLIIQTLKSINNSKYLQSLFGFGS